jgi:DNA helicase II / ATP-dependent DNA helicase PcrA
MDKRVIFAVAGAGKTTHIINSLSREKRALIVTYTDNNFNHLRQRVINKFGELPDNITIVTYFTFLYSFCYKPFLHDKVKSKGINWKSPHPNTFKLPRSRIAFYQDSTGRLYNNRIAKLIEQKNVVDYITARIEKYYDQLFVDEVQDFGGHDFNLLKLLCSSNVDINFVGDFYQHTFDTSNDGNTNLKLYDEFNAYQKHFKDVGMAIDTTSLSHSYRCTSQVCEFIRNYIGIDIESHKEEESEVLLITGKQRIKEIYSCEQTVKLFYQKYYDFDCVSQNWGKSKGQDHYIDVCIALYPAAMKAFKNNSFKTLPASSRNKLYVACTRANRNIYFIEQKQLNPFK